VNPRTTLLDRRRFLQVGVAGGAAVVLSSAMGATPARATGGPKVYVLVVDGTRPDEVTPLRMPQVAALRAEGTWFSRARSLPVMETIPNHVMMMTGVRPDRSGVPANAIFDRREGVERELDRPTDLRFPTVLERLEASGRTTGTVLSKEYLYGIFDGKATYQWEPQAVIPVSGHSPDLVTMNAAIAMVDRVDPDLVFVNLGNTDRVGHSDPTGGPASATGLPPLAREVALKDTDLQVRRFVDHLKATGRWERSLLIVLADHSMDWSLPARLISVAEILAGRPQAASVRIAQNGGADLLYWVGAERDRRRGMDEVRRLVTAHPGVLSVQQPRDLRLGPEAGDLVAYCRPGWRFSDPKPTSNPIPGNHGHPATEPIPFLMASGHPALRRGFVSAEEARTIDVAPTVGALFGLRPPPGGYDGRVRSSALRTPWR